MASRLDELASACKTPKGKSIISGSTLVAILIALSGWLANMAWNKIDHACEAIPALSERIARLESRQDKIVSHIEWKDGTEYTADLRGAHNDSPAAARP